MLPKAEQVPDLHFFIFLSISSTNYYPDQILVLFLHSESQKFLYVYLGTYIVNTTYILHLSIPLVYLYVSKTASIFMRGYIYPALSPKENQEWSAPLTSKQFESSCCVLLFCTYVDQHIHERNKGLGWGNLWGADYSRKQRPILFWFA